MARPPRARNASGFLLLPLLLLLAVSPSPSSGLDPFTWGIVIGGGVASTAFYKGWDQIKCASGYSECCSPAWVANNFTRLEGELNRHVFGQHLVTSVVTRSLRSHVSKAQPAKALVLSFHGWTGAGKNYVARFVAESLYVRGLRSKYVHLFIATVHFPNEAKLDEYRLQLQDWIRGNVTACAQSLFIFDEVDKLPVGLLDAIKAFVDYHESIGGVDFRRSVFIFLSNTGGREITKRTLEFWEAGKKREELQHRDFEALINRGAFNEIGGLHHSTVLEKSLVDHFIPFLPMERRHVRQCIEAEAGDRYLTEKVVSRILEEMVYWPESTQLYSSSGCKKVAQKVDLAAEGMYDEDEEDEVRDGSGDRSKREL